MEGFNFQEENTNTGSNLPKELTSIIKVIGVGGAGSNAVNHMFRMGIENVDFIVCNTDVKDLAKSPVNSKVQLGAKLTKGLGAGAKPEVGKNAAIENIDEIKNMISSNTEMVFITAGMGGGTGTGAAPIVAGIAKEMGVLTVGIVTIPFTAEGRLKRKHAEDGITEMRKNVDTLIIVCNDKLREIHGSLPFTQAYAKADDILATAAKAIADIISTTGIITVDFNDVNTVMKNGGTSIMGTAVAEGENRASAVVEAALSSPLLNDNNIRGAQHILLSVTTGSDEATMDEIGEIQDIIQSEAGDDAHIILGLNKDDSLGDKLKLIVVATGFELSKNLGFVAVAKEEKKVNFLASEVTSNVVNITPLVAPVVNTVVTEQQEVKSNTGIVDADGWVLKTVETKREEVIIPSNVHILFEAPVTLENKVEEVVNEIPTIEDTYVNTISEIEEAPIVNEIPSYVNELEEITMNFDSYTHDDVISEASHEVVSEIEVGEVVSEIAMEEEVEEEIQEELFEEEIVSEITSEEIIAEVIEEDVFIQEITAVEKIEESFSFNEIEFEIETTPVAETSNTITLGSRLNVEDETPEIASKFEELNKVVYDLDGNQINAGPEKNEAFTKKTDERITRLKNLNSFIKRNNLSELENEPAYKRRGMNLNNIPHSSESEVSKFTLSEDENKNIEIRPNNSFLHDNVD